MEITVSALGFGFLRLFRHNLAVRFLKTIYGSLKSKSWIFQPTCYEPTKNERGLELRADLNHKKLF